MCNLISGRRVARHTAVVALISTLLIACSTDATSPVATEDVPLSPLLSGSVIGGGNKTEGTPTTTTGQSLPSDSTATGSYF